MRFKNRFNETVAFLSFAFYPKITLVACVIFSVIVVTILGVAMALTPEGSGFSITCQTPAKKYKLYKSSINKSIHFAQRSLKIPGARPQWC